MEYFKLGAVLTLKDMLSEKMDGIKGKINGMRDKLRETGGDVQAFEGAMSRLKVGGALLGSGLVLAGGLIAARVESSKLEANIRSLGVTSAETDKIAQSTRIMASQYGVAKEQFLAGIYDIKSAVSSLDPGQLAGISEQIAKLALATKGDFAGLSDLFGVAYSQFKRMYKGLSDENFAALFGNTISYAANVYKTDGAKMQQAMQSLGASAAANNITLEEQSAVLGRLQNTMQAGVAGTSYRAFLTTVGDAFKLLGLRATDARGNLRSMPDLLDQLKKRFGESLDVKEQSVLKKAFGSDEALSFIKELLPNAKELRSEIKTIKDLNTKGDMKFVNEASAANLDNLSNQLDRVGAGWKAFKDLVSKGFGDSFVAPIAAKIADIFQWVQRIAEQNPAIGRMLSSLGGIVVGVTTVVGAIMAVSAVMKIYTLLMKKNAIVAAISSIATKAHGLAMIVFGNGLNFASIATGVLKIAQMGLNAVMSINPIFLLITAIAALIVYWDDLKKATVGAGDSLKKMSAEQAATMGPIISGLKLIIDNWEKIKAFFGIKLTAGDQLSMDLKKANGELDELKKKQELLTTAGQTKLPEYQRVTKEIKVQTEALEKLKGIESRRTEIDNGIQDITKKIDALKAVSPVADAASKTAIDSQIKSLTEMREKIQGALDAGDIDLAKKLGDKSALEKIEQSGVKLAQTFASGVSKGKPSIDVAVRDITTGIGRQLPQSDAKEGPLSNLTYRGRALVSTFGEGIEIEGRNNDAAAQFVKQTARKISPDSPVMQAITQSKGNSGMNFGSMFGNVQFSLANRELSREDMARTMTEFFMGMLQQAEA